MSIKTRVERLEVKIESKTNLNAVGFDMEWTEKDGTVQKVHIPYKSWADMVSAVSEMEEKDNESGK